MVSCSLEAKKLTFDFENLNLECIPVIRRGNPNVVLLRRDYKKKCGLLGTWEIDQQNFISSRLTG